MSKHLAASFILLLGACQLLVPVRAQTTYANVTGVVTDPTGAVLPNVTVTITSVETGVQLSAASNSAGVYTLAQLKEGRYTLRATSAGFKEYIAANLVLAAREERRLDVQMSVGAAQESVEVTAEQALIETETARISDQKTIAQLNTLPINQRDLTYFTVLSPQVVKARETNEFRFAGSYTMQNDLAIDGITTNNGVTGPTIGPLTGYIESFQEVRIDMANNTAEFGAVGQVTVVSKSGTNELHGSLFDYYGARGLNARNPFATTQSGGVTHSPGFSLGGPVVIPKLYNGRNRTFFFGAFEGLRGGQSADLAVATVPLAAWRAGDFSALLPTIIIRDPQTNQPFPGNRIPEARLNPVARRIQDRFFPLPNFGNTAALTAQNYQAARTRGFNNQNYLSARVDHHFKEGVFFFVRGTYTRFYFDTFDSPLPAIGQRWNRRDTRGLNASFTYTITPTFINEVRYGIAYNNNGRNGPLLGNEVVNSLGITGLAPDLPDINGTFNVSFANIGLTGTAQTNYRKPGFLNWTQQFQDQISWFKGRHTIKAGANLAHIRFDDAEASPNLFGAVNFSNRYTGHPYADFLLGLPTTSARAFGLVGQESRRWTYDFFATDNFKLSPKLTLSLGLRYELHPYWTEINGRQSTFDLASGRIVVPDGSLQLVSPLLPRSYVDVVEASAAGYPTKNLVNTDKNNFAPRLGVAWRPLDNNTVVRGGFGVYYDVTSRVRSTGGVVPFLIAEPAFNNPTGTPVVTLPRIFPEAGVGGPTTVAIPAATDPNLLVSYTLQYNVTIEHQRWNTGFRASYVGTGQRQAEYTLNANQPVADARLFVDKPRPFPRYPAINYLTNGAGHQYHGLSLEAERRTKGGMLWQLSYTLARDIGDVDRAQGIEDSYDRAREVGVNTDVPQHRLSGNLVYELPFGRGQRFLSGQARAVDLLAGGWQVSLIGIYTSGQFLTPLWTGPDPTGTVFTANRTPANVTIRPNILRDPNLPSDQRSINRWFDPTAFAAPTLGAFGTSARGVIVGPSSHVWHAGLYKAFNFTERVRLRLEATATNVFNHPNYANPNLNISTPNLVGTITGIGGQITDYDLAAQRIVRLGARLEW